MFLVNKDPKIAWLWLCPECILSVCVLPSLYYYGNEYEEQRSRKEQIDKESFEHAASFIPWI